jgi:hypothetical protein
MNLKKYNYAIAALLMCSITNGNCMTQWIKRMDTNSFYAFIRDSFTCETGRYVVLVRWGEDDPDVLYKRSYLNKGSIVAFKVNMLICFSKTRVTRKDAACIRILYNPELALFSAGSCDESTLTGLFEPCKRDKEYKRLEKGYREFLRGNRLLLCKTEDL